MTARWQQIKKLWNSNQWLLVIAGWVLGILTFAQINAFMIADAEGNPILDFFSDLVPEAVGILFTVLILDRLNEQRELEQLQNRLVREASGQANEASKAACDWMQFEGWLSGEESLLADTRVNRANMQGVDLAGAKLEKTDFYKSTLADANLFKIDGRNATFAYTDLSGADLVAADLRGATLEGANIDGVLWSHPNQPPAIMPDGKEWTPDTDMRRFTDWEHPEFWRSMDPESPAHMSMEDHWSRQRKPGV